MSLTFKTSYVRSFMHILLFSLYWAACSGGLSFLTGMIIFLVFYLPSLLPLVRGRFFSLNRLLLYSLFLLLLFPGARFYQVLTAGFSLPRDFGGILFLSHYTLIFPPLLLCLFLVFAVGKVSWFHVIEILIYAGVLAFFTGKPEWNLQDYSGRLIITFLAVAGGGGGVLLLLLWGGKNNVQLDLFRDIPVFLILLTLLLVPLSRLYRSESVKEGGGLLESSLFHFDFTDYLTLESKISMKDELVFLLQMEGAPDRSYLRRFILSAYDDKKGFFRDPEKTPESYSRFLPDYRAPEHPVEWEIPLFSHREDLDQTLYFINFDSAAFLGMNLPGEITPYYTWEDSSFSRIYKVRSSVSRAEIWDLMLTDDIVPSEENQSFMEYYTDWGGQNERDPNIRRLAEDITRGIGGYFQKIAAIQEYLLSEYLYSLSPGTAEDGDQLSYFLFETKKGYCSYFAFSMTLLCRSIGIPARVALGFWVDTGAEVLNFYPVNANQAHAWVEVYFPDFGWMEFDPTSQTLAPGENYEFAGFNPEELEPFISEILTRQGTLTVSDIQTDETSVSAGHFIRDQWNRALSHPYATAFLIILLLSGVSLLRVLVSFSPFPRKEKRIPYWYRLHRSLLISGLDLDGALTTPLELAEACRKNGFGEAEGFCRDYLTLRFAGKNTGFREETRSSWFKSAVSLRRSLFRFIGTGKTALLLAGRLLRPGRLP